jgi:hypothetical protein
MAQIWAQECIFALHADDLACCLTRDNAGINIASNNAMIAITTSSSISVKPSTFGFFIFVDSIFNLFDPIVSP